MVNIFKLNTVTAVVAIAIFSPFVVHASVGTVSGITVKEGQFTAQMRSSYNEDGDEKGLDHRLRTRLMTDYGFSDRVALGVHFQGDNPGDGNQEYDATLFEARVELADTKTDGYYGGFRLRYTFKDGDKKPDNVHIRLIAGVPINDWDVRLNQIIAHEVGVDSKGGLGMDTRLQATYAYDANHRVGVESFSDFGYGSRKRTFNEQNHSIGPVFTGKIDDTLSYETGYRYGVSEAAADHMVKLFLTKYF